MRRPASERRQRPQVVLGKGFSQMDWMRLHSKHPDPAGLEGQRPRTITLEEARRAAAFYAAAVQALRHALFCSKDQA